MNLLIKLTSALFCITSLFKRGIVVIAGFVDVVVIFADVVVVAGVLVANNSKFLFLRYTRSKITASDKTTIRLVGFNKLDICIFAVNAVNKYMEWF
jgi:hypothetical protein